MFQNTYRQKLGHLGEKIACDYLLKQGLILLRKNYLIRAGQLDLIFQNPQSHQLHFIEVKSRFQSYPTSDFLLSQKQRQTLLRTAEYFLQQSNLQLLSWQFDLVWINFSHSVRTNSQSAQLKAKIKYLPHAFIA